MWSREPISEPLVQEISTKRTIVGTWTFWYFWQWRSPWQLPSPYLGGTIRWKMDHCWPHDGCFRLLHDPSMGLYLESGQVIMGEHADLRGVSFREILGRLDTLLAGLNRSLWKIWSDQRPKVKSDSLYRFCNCLEAWRTRWASITWFFSWAPDLSMSECRWAVLPFLTVKPLTCSCCWNWIKLSALRMPSSAASFKSSAVNEGSGLSECFVDPMMAVFSDW